MLRVNARVEDARVLQRVDSFAIPVVVSALVAGFSVQLFGDAEDDSTKALTAVAVIFELLATTLFSTIAFGAKQTYNLGSRGTARTAKFLRGVRCVTTVALALYTFGLVLFGIGFLIQATRGIPYWYRVAVQSGVWTVCFVLWFTIKVAYSKSIHWETWESDPESQNLSRYRNGTAATPTNCFRTTWVFLRYWVTWVFLRY